jgi:hypothetical protein
MELQNKRRYDAASPFFESIGHVGSGTADTSFLNNLPEPVV